MAMNHLEFMAMMHNGLKCIMPHITSKRENV